MEGEGFKLSGPGVGLRAEDDEVWAGREESAGPSKVLEDGPGVEVVEGPAKSSSSDRSPMSPSMGQTISEDRVETANG